MTLSILIPVLDDALRLRRLLRDLQSISVSKTGARPADVPVTPTLQPTVRGTSARSPAALWPHAPEIIVVDGGSRDDSVVVAREAGVRVLRCGSGRGAQLQEGARVASGTWLWFLHADSRVSPEMLGALQRVCGGPPAWGRFDVRLVGTPLLPVIAAAMNWRSAVSGICTGDQGIFVHRSLLDAVGGVPRQPLMEDIELSKRLRRLAHPLRVRTPIGTSARRWRDQGVFKTVLLMWWLRLRYLCRAAPEELARRYYG